ncbi:UDP-glucose 4-epimerase GalE [Qipengyuania qiaonensis]|uniref:UDP-glucose 4-epimerase GalE n=1 Tax=Qipengyuania qiaonensis TaxID=2867240 RepID=UPI0031EEB305
MKTVLVTGGAGYVGAHCCKAFAKAGWKVVTFDNLSRGWRDSVKWGPLIEGDLLDAAAIGDAVSETKPDLVAHFAAFAYVGESMSDPASYYRNNCVGTMNLLDAMMEHGVKRMLFSSTCATYGIPERLPIDEGLSQNPINPYGRSKLVIEQVLKDYAAAYGLSSVSLRYFNAAGADPDGEIGEKHEPETHAIPLAIAASLEPGSEFTVLGTDFETRDGSAVRDYIHVADLADAHVAGGEFLMEHDGCHAFNLGTGVGTSVIELLDAVERATGQKPNARFGPRRAGDPPALVASYDKIERCLGWTPKQSGIDRIVETAVSWHRRQSGET